MKGKQTDSKNQKDTTSQPNGEYNMDKASVMTTKEVAKFLGLKPRTIREYNRTRKLKGRRYSKNGPLLFLEAEVLAYRKQNLHDAASY